MSGGELHSGHNGICASSPHQVIGLEWPCHRQVLKKLVSPVAPSLAAQASRLESVFLDLGPLAMLRAGIPARGRSATR